MHVKCELKKNFKLFPHILSGSFFRISQLQYVYPTIPAGRIYRIYSLSTVFNQHTVSLQLQILPENADLSGLDNANGGSVSPWAVKPFIVGRLIVSSNRPVLLMKALWTAVRNRYDKCSWQFKCNLSICKYCLIKVARVYIKTPSWPARMNGFIASVARQGRGFKSRWDLKTFLKYAPWFANNSDAFKKVYRLLFVQNIVECIWGLGLSSYHRNPIPDGNTKFEELKGCFSTN